MEDFTQAGSLWLHLNEAGPSTRRECAEATGIDASAVSALFTGMLRAGTVRVPGKIESPSNEHRIVNLYEVVKPPKSLVGRTEIRSYNGTRRAALVDVIKAKGSCVFGHMSAQLEAATR